MLYLLEKFTGIAATFAQNLNPHEGICLFSVIYLFT